MDAIKKAGKYIGKSVAGKVINTAYKAGWSRLKHWRQPKFNRSNFINFLGKQSMLTECTSKFHTVYKQMVPISSGLAYDINTTSNTRTLKLINLVKLADEFNLMSNIY